jgi:hypothetical protein
LFGAHFRISRGLTHGAHFLGTDAATDGFRQDFERARAAHRTKLLEAACFFQQTIGGFQICRHLGEHRIHPIWLDAFGQSFFDFVEERSRRQAFGLEALRMFDEPLHLLGRPALRRPHLSNFADLLLGQRPCHTLSRKARTQPQSHEGDP